jgi:hypothetical protein
MSEIQQGTAEGDAQGTGPDREGNPGRDHEWVRREELSAVVAERNELKRKYREASAQLRQLQESPPGADPPAKEAAQRAEESQRRYERLWVDHQILSAAEGGDAISGPAVVQLFRPRVQTRRREDGEVTAVCTDRRGEPLTGEDGRPVQIAEAVKRFLAEPENAFLIRSRYPGGGGTGSGPRSAPLPAALDELTAEQVGRLSDSEFERLNEQRRRHRAGFRW